MQLQCDGHELGVAIVRSLDRTDWRSQSELLKPMGVGGTL